MHWLTKYIGIPYEKLDCWEFVRLAYREKYGLDLPDYPGVDLKDAVKAFTEMRKGLELDWEETPEPFDGALVAMSQRREIHHTGIYAAVEQGRFVHSWRGIGVVADTRNGLRLRGILIVKFYRYHLWPSS